MAEEYLAVLDFQNAKPGNYKGEERISSFDPFLSGLMLNSSDV